SGGSDMQECSMSGVVPILATPFATDGRLDRGSLRRLVEFQVSAGVQGVATFGMASETFTLTSTERTQILADVVAEASGLPVVAGVGATAVEPAREQLLEVAEQGASTA